MKYRNIVSVMGSDKQAKITGDESTLVVVKLDFQIAGKIVSAGQSGHSFMEADLSRAKVQMFEQLATVLASTIEHVHGWESNQTSVSIRWVDQGGDGLIQPEIHVRARPGNSLEGNALKSTVAHFCHQLSPNVDFLNAIPDNTLTPEQETQISVGVQSFLSNQGGKSLPCGVQLLVDQRELVSLKGAWQNVKVPTEQVSREVSVEVLYNGRRLRTRTLFVTLPGARISSLEIDYDEEKFDDALRELADDKRAALKLTFRETKNNRDQQRRELLSLSRIPLPEHLELTSYSAD